MPLDVRIVLERYGFLDGRPRSVGEVAAAHGLSRSRVRRLEARALVRLRGAHVDAARRRSA